MICKLCSCSKSRKQTCISRTQLSVMACLVSAVYSSHMGNIGKFRIGVSQLNVAESSVRPLGVGHVSLGWSPSLPGISGGSGGSIAPSGSRSSSESVNDVSRFFLLKHRQRAHDSRGSSPPSVSVALNLPNVPRICYVQIARDFSDRTVFINIFNIFRKRPFGASSLSYITRSSAVATRQRDDLCC